LFFLKGPSSQPQEAGEAAQLLFIPKGGSSGEASGPSRRRRQALVEGRKQAEPGLRIARRGAVDSHAALEIDFHVGLSEEDGDVEGDLKFRK
jgi:hypothetical protein